jgi:hypothetical protein
MSAGEHVIQSEQTLGSGKGEDGEKEFDQRYL